MASGATRPASWRMGLLLAMASVAVTILLVEGSLRLAGIEYHLLPSVQFGWPDPEALKARYAEDPDLFWVTQDYREKLRAARRTHPAIVFLGDSCTEFGTYPERTVALLKGAYTPIATTGIAMATGGWSSEQGLAQLDRDILPLRPHVVVIYFGWNDHWVALGPTDRQLRTAHRFLWLAERSRLVQVVFKATMGVSGSRHVLPNRVSAERYKRNLMTMAAEARAAGIVPVLVTAPSNHIPGHEPERLALRHLRSLSELVPLHQQYVQLTRDAAHDSGAVLCDAAAAFAALPAPPTTYFMADGIHFTGAGDQQLAHVVSGCILRALGH